MLTLACPLPTRRPDLLFKPLGDDGQHVVKDPRTGAYFKLPAQESFLFTLLDGRHTPAQMLAAFERRFGEPLAQEDLEQFLSLAREADFLCESNGRAAPVDSVVAHDTDVEEPAVRVAAPERASPATGPAESVAKKPQRQSLLYWRASVFDPDRLFTRVEPSIRFIWTRAFVVLSAAFIAAAFVVSWTNRRDIVADFSSALVMRWETLLLAWLMLVVATTLHEFAHGLTCKHHGGEVHEVGFLLMFFIPCFYCNVSDAWLIQQKSKRLWVTLAGAWCDLCAWAAAVFVWRLTPVETVPHYLSWVLMGVTGVRVFFNFNPLLKLDGYYLLSDAVNQPNLRGRALERLAAHVRWLLWGAPRPGAERAGRLLLWFGTATWVYSAVFLCLMVAGFVRWWGSKWGAAGAVAALVLGAVTSRGMFVGFTGGEVTHMLQRRKVRAAAWGLALAAVVAAACVVTIPDRAGGPFRLRALRRAELRAPVAGFLREARYAEGQRVAGGAVVARLEVPDLASKLLQKEAELAEADAKLGVLRAEPESPAGAARDDGRVQSWQIRAGEAQLRRLREELAYLRSLERRQPVASPVDGLLITPRLAEKVGQYFHEGELICEVEDPSVLEAEIAVPEQEMARVRPGLEVELKARVAPFDTLRAKVTRVATTSRAAVAAVPGAAPPPPAAETGELPGHVTVYCTLSDSAAAAGARPGMTGHARIDRGSDVAGKVLGRRLMQYVRTEFWW